MVIIKGFPMNLKVFPGDSEVIREVSGVTPRLKSKWHKKPSSQQVETYELIISAMSHSP